MRIVRLHPCLKNSHSCERVDAKHWDFILTIAGVFVAVDQLVNLGLSENRQQKLMGKVGAKLIQRHPSNGRHGFEDCAAFLREKFKRVCK